MERRLPGRLDAKRRSCEMCGLRRVCFPARVADGSVIGASAARIRRMRIARGNALYRAGDRIESLYMVRSGCIKEIDAAGATQDAVANFCLPGDLLTLQGAGGARSRTTCLAVETSHICAVPWPLVEQACAAAPGIAGELVELVVNAGASARELLTMVRDKDALQRVAGFLSSMCIRLRRRGLRGRDFRLGMSRNDIANYLGLRSETVSRCFSELARRGLVRVRAKHVQVSAPDELRRLYLGEVAITRE